MNSIDLKKSVQNAAGISARLVVAVIILSYLVLIPVVAQLNDGGTLNVGARGLPNANGFAQQTFCGDDPSGVQSIRVFSTRGFLLKSNTGRCVTVDNIQQDIVTGAWLDYPLTVHVYDCQVGPKENNIFNNIGVAFAGVRLAPNAEGPIADNSACGAQKQMAYAGGVTKLSKFSLFIPYIIGFSGLVITTAVAFAYRRRKFK